MIKSKCVTPASLVSLCWLLPLDAHGSLKRGSKQEPNQNIWWRPSKKKPVWCTGDSRKGGKKDLFSLFVVVSIFYIFVSSGSFGSIADGAGQSCPSQQKRGLYFSSLPNLTHSAVSQGEDDHWSTWADGHRACLLLLLTNQSSPLCQVHQVFVKINSSTSYLLFSEKISGCIHIYLILGG